jgi:hypothetical protein
MTFIAQERDVLIDGVANEPSDLGERRPIRSGPQVSTIAADMV